MPKRNAGDGSPSEPVKGESFRGEFTRLEREYVLARSILAARHATGMSKGAFAKAVGASKGKLSRWERAEAIPRLEVLQRIANVTGLSFQIGIEPLETPKPASTKTSNKRSATRKASGKKTTTRKASERKSTTRRSSARKTGAGRSAATGSTERKSPKTAASAKSSRAKGTRKSPAGGAS
ncbi:MAG TPA: helix-turn-helix domain-containing protein [Actinomycetota bacterium]|nr:helix-turn-helix domain-containing protein [Actinomycetota bacterium]